MKEHHKEKKDTVVTRFPPSPTGNLHIGGLRTALFNFLYAKHNNGKFVFRIEDTDRERSKKEYEQNIIDGLNWLGLSYDNKEITRQSERSEIYRKYLEKLISEDKAYLSKENPLEENKEGNEDKPARRSEVIRLRNPNVVIKFSDIIRGEISFSTNELGDFIIAKSLTEPLYHFTVVVDDHEMGITHIIRGEDHISNTPRQILIGEAIGAKRPIYGHLPLILSSDRSKLSKRKGAQAMTEYQKEGFLASALLNYAALLGWNPGTNEEIFSLEELIKKFDIARVQKAGAVYDEEKLRWVNRQHLQKLDRKDLEQKFYEIFKESEYVHKKKWEITNEMIGKITPTVLDRIETFGDVNKFIEDGEVDYVLETPKYDTESLIWKGSGAEIIEKTMRHLLHVQSVITEMTNEDLLNSETIKSAVWDYATVQGRGEVLWPIRFALTGRTKSTDPFTVISIIGKEKSLDRINHAIKNLQKLAGASKN